MFHVNTALKKIETAVKLTVSLTLLLVVKVCMSKMNSLFNSINY